MGHLALPFGHDLDPPPAAGSGCRLTVLVDSGGGSMERRDIELGPAWGRPEIAHMVLTQMFRTREWVEIQDVAGDIWALKRATLRAFWLHGLV